MNKYGIIYIIITFILLILSPVFFYVSYIFDKKYLCIDDTDNDEFNMKKLYLILSGTFAILFFIMFFLIFFNLNATILLTGFLFLFCFMIYIWSINGTKQNCSPKSEFIKYFTLVTQICKDPPNTKEIIDIDNTKVITYCSISFILIFLFIILSLFKNFEKIKNFSIWNLKEPKSKKNKKILNMSLLFLLLLILALLATLGTVTGGNYNSLECVKKTGKQYIKKPLKKTRKF